MIVLDASVLIAHLVRTDRLHGQADAMLARVIGDDFGISPITLAEVYVTPTKEGKLADAQRAITSLEITELPLAGGTAVDLARLRHETRLKLPDCCVLLAAAQHGGEVASFDTKLITAAVAQGLTIVQ